MKRNFTIGEISGLFGVGTDSIRYYEKLGALHPARAANGYRLYSIEEVWRLNVIRDLRGQGISMRRINKYLTSRTVATTLALLDEEAAAIDAQLARLARRRENVCRRQKAVRDALAGEVGRVQLRHFPGRRCYQINEPYATDAEMDVLMQRLLKRDLDGLYVVGSNHFGSFIPRKAARQGRCNAYSGVFVVNPQGDATLPGGSYLCLRYQGSSKHNDTYLPLLLAEAASMGLEPIGDILELVLVDVHVSENEKEHVLELQVPVAKAGQG